METHENAETSGNGERESIIQKLDEIEGIGRKTAEAMYQIGIRNEADLARFISQHKTAKEISEVFKQHDINLPSGLIHPEKWIRSVSDKPDQTSPSLPVEETEAVKSTEETHSDQKSRDHKFEFTVFFDIVRDLDDKPVLQTTVYNPKDAGEERSFIGNNASPWVNWMLEQVNPSFVVEPIAPQVEVVAPPTSGKPIDVRIEIADVNVSIVKPLAKIPEKRLKAKIHFWLYGVEADALSSQSLPLQTEIYTVNMDTGVLELVASGENWLEAHQFEYTYPIEFAFPDVGRYGILSFVRLRPYGDLIAFHWSATKHITPS